MRVVAEPSQSVDAKGLVPSHPHQGSVSARKGVHGAFWRIALGMAGAVCLASLSFAASFTNSFVTVEGDGVRIADDGSIHFPNAKSPVAVEVTARSGWKVNGRKAVSLTRAPGASGPLRVTSDLGEDSEHIPLVDCQFDSVVSNAHIAPPAIGVAVSERQLLMYALPDTNVLVSASAACETLSNGLHEVTTTWLPCPVCHAAHDPAEEKVQEEIAPGAQSWRASAADVEANSNTWTGYMTKGRGQQMSFRVVATNDCRKCICEASTNVVVDVYELSVTNDLYVGLDRTDAGRTNLFANAKTATALIAPAPSGEVSYSWKNCGICSFTGRTDQATVCYFAPDPDVGSAAYLAEPLIVEATIEDGDLTASAACTTNFTVVKVDVTIARVGEDKEETEGAFVQYVPDTTNGLITVEGTNQMVGVMFSCEPTDLPTNEVVTITSSGPGELYEELANGELVLITTTNYPACELAGRKFKLHGHDGSGSLRDGRIRIVQPTSHAIDEATFTIFGIKTETIATTPANRTRKTIGVGEELIATFYPSSLNSVTWSVNGGGSIDKLSGNPITFTATNRASTATITAESSGLRFEVLLSVIEPNGVRMRKICENPIPSGWAGADMNAEVQLQPMTVSFYNVQILEIPGPASDITGYFTIFSPSSLFHSPSPNWLEFSQNNVARGHDHCGFVSSYRPWSDGSYVWHIPWHFRVGTSDGGKQFTVVDQEFSILADGTFEVRKAGASVIRVP